MGVRKARLEDLKEIDRIYTDGSIDEGRLQFPDVSRNKMIRQLKEDAKSRMRGFKKDLKNKKHFWIAVGVGDKIAGFGQAWLKNKDTGVIEKVYVGMRHRKKGTGKKIILLLVKWLKTSKMLFMYPACFNSQKIRAFLIVLKNSNTLCGFSPEFLTKRRLNTLNLAYTGEINHQLNCMKKLVSSRYL